MTYKLISSDNKDRSGYCEEHTFSTKAQLAKHMQKFDVKGAKVTELINNGEIVDGLTYHWVERTN